MTQPPPAAPIAIIGLAVMLPGADHDLERLNKLLLERTDMIRPPADHRKADSSLHPDSDLAECALLERIDLFDHDFFGLSLREAQQMDPQQRALLTLSCRAIWEAGYGISDLRGKSVATIFGSAAQTYSSLFPDHDPGLVTGLLPAAQAGRVAHLLDLRGPALVVDTACSSSLFAIQDACARLQSGSVAFALAGGVRLMNTLPVKHAQGNEGIISPSGRARSFDAMADGTGLGEGGAVFLLKRLDQAIADGDVIRAVIRSAVTNQDGGQSNGFTAPSAAAQEALILQAWRESGIDPQSIGFIEAHGTGTRLGDPIEFEGLSKAFARYDVAAQNCVLSSIKSNIGHLDSAAGAAGLAKVVTALSTGQRYASAHFERPNALLKIEGSALLLATDAQPWPENAPRRAGISAFGLTGTNVHLVVESPPEPNLHSPDPADSCPVLIPLAARSEEGLRTNAARLAQFLECNLERPSSLADLAYTQACGRDHDRWRACIVAATAREAIAALSELGTGGGNATLVADAVAPIFTFPHAQGPETHAWEASPLANYETLSEVCKIAAPEGLISRLALANILVGAGFPDRFVICNGNGAAAVALIQSDLNLVEACEHASAEKSIIDADQVGKAIAQISRYGDPVLIVPWQGELADVAEQYLPEFQGMRLDIDAALSPRNAIIALISGAYRAGVTLNWSKTVSLLGGYGRRASIPAEILVPTRCWIENRRGPVRNTSASSPDPMPSTEAEEVQSMLAEPDGTPAEQALARIWCAVLGTKKVSRDDDFFDLGGNSLMQTQLDNRILVSFGVKMAIDDIYDFATLHEMAAHLETLSSNLSSVAATPSHDPDRNDVPASHAQRRMWVLQELEPTSGAYNVTGTFKIEGAVDPIRLRSALDGLVARHDILRTRLVMNGGTLVQHVEPEKPFSLEVIKAQDSEATIPLLVESAARPFDLAEAGAARALLIVEPKDCVAWFQLVLHHAICDEWSIHLILDELSHAYDDPTDRAPPPIQFADWAAWEMEREVSDEFERDGTYWREQLANLPGPVDLPSDFPRPSQPSHKGSWVDVALSPELVQRMRTEARARDGTLFTWLMTSYAAWLSGLCQIDDFIIGVPVAGRHNAAAEQIVGCFINTLPLRIDTRDSPSFSVLFDRVRKGLNNAIEHQRYPFDRMVEETGTAGNASGNPLVQTLLSLQGARSSYERRLGGSPMFPIELPGRVSWFDLSAVLRETPDGGLTGILAYRDELFEEATIRGFWSDWSARAEAGLVMPDMSIHDLCTENSW